MHAIVISAHMEFCISDQNSRLQCLFDIVIMWISQHWIAPFTTSSHLADTYTFTHTAGLLQGPLKLPRLGRDLLLFCGLGLSGMFGGQLFYILGVFYAGPDVASVVQPVRLPPFVHIHIMPPWLLD